ncbi:Fic/DOC family protein [Halopseudomonas salegens]|uniref:Fic/DOC family protein n=1 Tax=Halopseudomonas salegens TaxID=1434072 RepID=UPI001E39EDC3|nr:Fic family protein [Halopseudomonas salegens]
MVNKLNISDESDLENAERDLTQVAAEAIEFCPPPYDFEFFKELHRQLFEDIYPWAGEVRIVDVSKGSTRFCTTSRIEPEARKIFSKLAEQRWFSGCTRDELIKNIAEFSGDLNILHPFREGNGRAMRLLCDFIVINAGYQVDWSPVDSALWLQASIDSVRCDYQAMQQVYSLCIGEELPV